MNLLELRLSFIDLSNFGVEDILKPLTSLLILDVDGCNLDSLLGIGAVAKTLTSLNAQDNNLEVRRERTTETKSEATIIITRRFAPCGRCFAPPRPSTLTNCSQDFDDSFKEIINNFTSLKTLDLRENELVDSGSNYRTTMLSLLPSLVTLDNLKCKASALPTNEALSDTLKNDVEKNDENGNLSVEAIKEFDAAMKGEVDNVAVG